jgi:hypothetical protein
MMNTDDGYYTITIGCGTGLIPDGEVESDFVDTYRGQVLFHHEDSDEEEIAGDFYARYIRCVEPNNAINATRHEINQMREWIIVWDNFNTPAPPRKRKPVDWSKVGF